MSAFPSAPKVRRNESLDKLKLALQYAAMTGLAVATQVRQIVQDLHEVIAREALIASGLLRAEVARMPAEDVLVSSRSLVQWDDETD